MKFFFGRLIRRSREFGSRSSQIIVSFHRRRVKGARTKGKSCGRDGDKKINVGSVTAPTCGDGGWGGERRRKWEGEGEGAVTFALNDWTSTL